MYKVDDPVIIIATGQEADVVEVRKNEPRYTVRVRHHVAAMATTEPVRTDEIKPLTGDTGSDNGTGSQAAAATNTKSTATKKAVKADKKGAKKGAAKK